MKTISINESLEVSGGSVQQALNLLVAKVSFDFVASAFAGGLGSTLMRNALNFAAPYAPVYLNPSFVIGVTAGTVGGALSHQVPALGHNMGIAMGIGAISGLASYTTNTTGFLY